MMHRMLVVITVVSILLACRQLDIAGELQWYQEDTWSTLIKAHKSHLWIVHFWGMSCGPCRAELSAWSAFLRNHPHLAVTFIEIDPVDDLSAVREVLSNAGLIGGEHWVCAYGLDERQRYIIDQKWGGELPFTLLISRGGSVQAINGTMDFHCLDSWLRKHLQSEYTKR